MIACNINIGNIFHGKSLIVPLAHINTHTPVALGLGILPAASSVVSVPLLNQLTPHTSTLAWAATPAATTLAWSGLNSGSPDLSQQVVGGSASQGLSLSPATETFPRRLVDRVRAGQFVEMRDLLTDNISLLQQLETFHSNCQLPSLPGVLRPKLREVASLSSWVYCFLAYIAIRSDDPGTRHLLAYARLVVRESQRHGGRSFMDYDRVFRQQAALDSAMTWNSIHPGIQAATLWGTTPGPVRLCTLCREPDHAAGSCALMYLQQGQPQPHVQQVQLQAQQQPPAGANVRQRPARRRPTHPDSQRGICISWNKGHCRFHPDCSYTHACATCDAPDHAAITCKETPESSEYWRPPPAARGRAGTRGGRKP